MRQEGEEGGQRKAGGKGGYKWNEKSSNRDVCGAWRIGEKQKAMDRVSAIRTV
jgi:hypothetical protein